MNPDTWIERVRAADAEAEASWANTKLLAGVSDTARVIYALTAIAAELRAQRIARRPGAGQ